MNDPIHAIIDSKLDSAPFVARDPDALQASVDAYLANFETQPRVYFEKQRVGGGWCYMLAIDDKETLCSDEKLPLTITSFYQYHIDCMAHMSTEERNEEVTGK